ncbi:MAG: class I SAM-dependent methyltransferase [Anaerolineales bacterium]|jgi:SAM-dependent methyltransferase
MDGFDADAYGERIAGVYDEMYSQVEAGCLDFLLENARSGRALELGVGTGRIALPLAAQGIEVHGIDASPAMVDKLKQKAGSEQIALSIGSFEAFDLGLKFDLVYVVFNTFYALLTQQAQISCFEHVAKHLTPSGTFVLEAFVPDLTRFTAGQALRVISIDEDRIRLDASLHDPVNQLVSSQHILFTAEGTRMYPVRLRYAWPSELDLMARLAGMIRIERWGSWGRDEFTAGSRKHVSVYRLE